VQLRWRIGGLLGVGVLINYFDRISLSVAAPQLQQDFGLSSIDMGLLLSAFFWSYALLQIPAGVALDRFGVTRLGRWSGFLWAVASALAAGAGGFMSMLVARVLLGAAEAPSFPANAKATGYWFPRNERAMATALFDAAAKFSNVVGVPLVALAVVHLGWRCGFGLVAFLSVLYFVMFWRVYRDPSRHPGLTPREREYILANGRTERHATVFAGPPENLGSVSRLWRLRLLLLFLSDVAAGLLGANHAHEHHQVGEHGGNPVGVCDAIRSFGGWMAD
jgi:MFS family permease